jgi:hypothetical protein
MASSATLRSLIMNNTPCCTGEAIPLHAGAHSPRPPRALHLEAPCYRGELHVDGQHPTSRASTPAPPSRKLSRPTRLVPSSPHQQRRLTLWQGFGVGDLSAFYNDDYSSSDPRTSDELLRRGSLLPAATAAAALASLHNHRPEFDWDSDPVGTRVAASCSSPAWIDTLTKLL